MGRAEATGLAVPALPIVAIPKAIEYSTLDPSEIDAIARKVLDEVVGALTEDRETLIERYKNSHSLSEIEKRLSRPKTTYETNDLDAPETIQEVNDLFYDHGWTDGLPIIPPTEEAVAGMLRYSDLAPDDVIGKVAPKWGKATVQKVAVNAVMAGCRPEYFPVVVTAIKAISDPRFNLFAIQATTNQTAPLAIVNGPIVKELGINFGFNAFGQGWRSNATIGRAIRLVMINIGGGIPGTTDKATQGQPGKFSFCVAENEEDSPWDPLHVERGYGRDVSTVTVAGVTGTLHFSTGGAGTPMSILTMAADCMAVRGAVNMYLAGGPILALNPAHASILARAGYSKDDVKRFIYDNATIPFSKWPVEVRADVAYRRPKLNLQAEDAVVNLADRWEDIIVLVVGATGVHNLCLHTHGDPVPDVTKPITLRDGSTAKSVADFVQEKR